MRQRWEQALAWAAVPAPGWFGKLCHSLELGADDAPARLRQRVVAGDGEKIDGPGLVIFGASALSLGEQRVLLALEDLLPIQRIRVVGSPARWSSVKPPAVSSPLLQTLGRSKM